MLQVGLEKEFFALNEENEVVLVPDKLPRDDCGWLVEARGEPAKDIVEAVFSLRAAVFRINKSLAQYNANNHPENAQIPLSDAPVMRVYKETRIEAQRRNDKGRIKYRNLYGHDTHRTTLAEATAGVHVTFSNAGKVHCKEETFSYNANFDWPYIFHKLDRAFEEEIKAAKRNPGFYEVKTDGRVEYRSLPANVDLDKLIEVLGKIISARGVMLC